MKKTIEIQNCTMQCVKLILTTASLLLIIFILCSTSYAQANPPQTEVHDKSLKSYKLPPNLKKHLQKKHKDQIEEVTSDLQETPQGPRGSLIITGHIKPKNVESLSKDKTGRARAIAHAFLKDEAELLGLSDLSEMREYKILSDKVYAGEYIHIYYVRYINGLQFENTSLHIKIGPEPDESITYVDASLVPAPSELYHAVEKK